MLYAIVAQDHPDSLTIRLDKRTEHRQRIQELQTQGRLLTAGPFPAVDNNDPGPAGFTGSLIVADFASLEQAKAWADTDPYAENGVFASVTVKPYVNVLS